MRALVVIILSLSGAVSLCAQVRFIENGGQWPAQVSHSTQIPGGRLYVESDGILINLYDAETVSNVFAHHAGGEPIPHPKRLKQHAYKLSFVGARTDVDPEGVDAQSGEFAFFLGDDPRRWAGGLRAFEKVTAEEIYPGIDLVVHGATNPKYDLVLRPGSRVDDVRIAYEGVKPKLQKDGSLLIPTSVGNFVETKPYAYQRIDGEEVEVECAYVQRGNAWTFLVGEYRNDLDLVIDPELVFSTYSGSFADNFGYTATYDLEGHLYSGSTAFGTGYPMTVGSYQTTWGGGQGAGNLPGMDIAITKFKLDGTGLIYSTYLGGSGDEMPHSLVTDSTGALYVFGTTGSANFPITSTAFQTEFKGGNGIVIAGTGVNYAQGCDMFVSRLSPSGQELDASTFLGGTANDGINSAQPLKHNYADEIRGEVDIDHLGRVVVGSCTYSADFPVLEQGYQPLKSDMQEGVIVRLDAALENLLHSTFFGGVGHDAIYSIQPLDDGRLAIGGGTSSTDLTMPSDAFQPVYGGGSADGMAAIFSEELDDLQVATYYGTDKYDQIYFVEVDALGFPHVFGQTRTQSEYFSANAAYGQPSTGMFVSKFLPDFTDREWSTTFGTQAGVPALSPVAFAVDICNRIYIAGWGGAANGFGGTIGLEITDDAMQTTTDNSDFYFMALNGDASSLEFATYYGGALSPEHVDGGTSRFDRKGNIYLAVCAGCGGNDDFPIYPDNAHSSTNNSFNCNLGVAKINFDMPLALADFTADDVCLPDSMVFTNTSSVFSGGDPTFHWDFGNGEESFDASPTMAYDEPGTYLVQLVVTDPFSCNLSDTLTKSVTVFPEIVVDLPDSLLSCTETEFELTAATAGVPQHFVWAEDPGFTDILLEGLGDSVLTYSPPQDGFVYVLASTGMCAATDSVFLSPAPNMHLSLGDTLLCSVDTLVITADFWPDDMVLASLVWGPDDVILQGQNTNEVTVSSDEPYHIVAEAISPFGCELSADAVISVHPVALEVSADTVVCTADPIELTADSRGLAETFEWSTDSDFTNILNDPTDSTVVVIPDSFTYYYVRVENNGCSLVDSVWVSVLSLGTTVTPDFMVCAGDTAHIFVTNDFPGVQLTHDWSPEEHILSGQGGNAVSAVVNETLTLTVVSSTAEGCEVENSVTIHASPLGRDTVHAWADPYKIIRGNSAELFGSPDNPAYIYQWEPPGSVEDPHAPFTSASPEETTTYTLTVSDASLLGLCARTDTVTIRVFDSVCGPPNIFVPNAFSPNGDGENDVLYVRGGVVTELQFTLFDRWGEKVFETRDLNVGWDGKYKGRMAEPAVFVYYLEAKCGESETYFEKGNVTVIR